MKKKHDVELYRNNLSNLFYKFSDVPKIILDEYIKTFSLELFPKKSVLISPNSGDNKLYFIVEGLIRIYYVAENKEITSDFKESNSFFANGYTMFTGCPNIDYYVALQDTVCLTSNSETFEFLASKYHSIEHLARKLVEMHYADFLIYNYNNLFLSAEDRYNDFVKKRSSIISKVSQKYIASHLGIKPETLSRLRAKQQENL